MPEVHFGTDAKFPTYDIVPAGTFGGDPALLSEDELAFFHDARSREVYVDALIAHRLDPDDKTADWLDQLTRHLEEAGIPVPAPPTAGKIGRAHV